MHYLHDAGHNGQSNTALPKQACENRVALSSRAVRKVVRARKLDCAVDVLEQPQPGQCYNIVMTASPSRASENPAWHPEMRIERSLPACETGRIRLKLESPCDRPGLTLVIIHLDLAIPMAAGRLQNIRSNRYDRQCLRVCDWILVLFISLIYRRLVKLHGLVR